MICPAPGPGVLWEIRIPTQASGKTALISSVLVNDEGYLNTQNEQPVINYNALYPKDHIRYGSPVLNMLVHDLILIPMRSHTPHLTAIITGQALDVFLTT